MMSRVALPDPRMSSVMGNMCVLSGMGENCSVVFVFSPETRMSFDEVMDKKGCVTCQNSYEQEKVDKM